MPKRGSKLRIPEGCAPPWSCFNCRHSDCIMPAQYDHTTHPEEQKLIKAGLTTRANHRVRSLNVGVRFGRLSFEAGL